MVSISPEDFLRRAASPPPSTGDNLTTGAVRIAAFKPSLIVMSSSCVNEQLTCHLGIHGRPLPNKKGQRVDRERNKENKHTHKLTQASTKSALQVIIKIRQFKNVLKHYKSTTQIHKVPTSSIYSELYFNVLIPHEQRHFDVVEIDVVFYRL